MPQKFAVGIAYLNSCQVVVQTVRGIVVVNTKHDRVDFKVKFIYSMNLEVSTSRGYVCVPRLENGVLLEFGEDCDEGVSQQMMSSSRGQGRSFKNMNDIKYQFDEVYGGKFEFYICIDETVVNWSSRHKLLPIKIQLADYVHKREAPQPFLVDKYEAGANSKASQQINSDPIEYYTHYTETTLLCLTYNNDFTIWEALIRRGLLQREVEISDSQLDRICNPVLADDNNSLLHKMSQHSIKDLNKLFAKTAIAEHFNQQNKRYPLFLNFDGESPLDLAMKSFDFESFDYLLQQTIALQDGWESSHLVDSWLLKAMRLELDIKPLFESKLCSQRISRENFAHFR